MKLTSALLIVSTALLFACGDDGGGADPEPDAAPEVCVPAGAEGACLTSSNFCDIALSQPIAQSLGGAGMDTPAEVLAAGALNMEAMPDIFVLEMYNTFGAFAEAGQITPGTYPITGDELQYSSCGVCLRIFTDLDAMGNSSDSGYLATGGSITLTSISPNLTFELNDVTFGHVNITPAPDFQSSPHPDGCQSAIESIRFDAAVTYTPAM